MKPLVYTDDLCTRCGSKRAISRTWKETIPTYSGKTTEVEYSQIICTNPECQKGFEENLAKETKKKEEIRLDRVKKDEERKEQALKQANEFIKNKLD